MLKKISRGCEASSSDANSPTAIHTKRSLRQYVPRNALTDWQFAYLAGALHVGTLNFLFGTDALFRNIKHPGKDLHHILTLIATTGLRLSILERGDALLSMQTAAVSTPLSLPRES